MARKLNLLFTAQPYTVQSSVGRVFVTGGPPELSVAGITGTIVNGQVVTLAGTNFGPKSRATAPLVLDTGADAPIGSRSPQYDGDNLSNFSPNFQFVNRGANFTPVTTNFGTPHPFITSITAGCHDNDIAGNPSAGFFLAKNLGNFNPASSPYPAVFYMRYFHRDCPEWDTSIFTGSTINDQNYKFLSLSANQPGVIVDCIIVAYDVVTNYPTGGWFNTTHAHQIGLAGNSSTTSLIQDPDKNGHSHFWGNSLIAINPANGWILREIEICIDNTINGPGYFTVTEPTGNGVIVNYSGITDNMANDASYNPNNPVRWFAFGGLYSRNNPGPNQWTAVSDVYMDMTTAGISGHCARVIFGDAPTHAASVIRAPALIQSWSNTSIQCQFRQDKFKTGNTAFAHVITQSNGILDNVQSFVIG